MVLSPGHRKQLAKALDLLTHYDRKSPSNNQTFKMHHPYHTKLPHVQHNFGRYYHQEGGWENLGFRHRTGVGEYEPHNYIVATPGYGRDFALGGTERDWIDIVGTMRQSAKNRAGGLRNAPVPLGYEEVYNRGIFYTNHGPRHFEWAVQYDPRLKKYRVFSKGRHLARLMTKEQILQRLDDKLLVDVTIPQAGIRGRPSVQWTENKASRIHASINQSARAVKKAHADATADAAARQTLLANLLRAVGARRKNRAAHKAKLASVHLNLMHRPPIGKLPGGPEFLAAGKRFHADSAAGQPAKRQKQ